MVAVGVSIAMIGIRPSLNSFVDRQIKYKTLRPQFAILFVAGVLFALDLGSVYYHFSGTEARSIYGAVLFMLMAGYLLIPLLVWFVGTLVIFLIARMIGARVQFGILLRANGWGMIPFVGTGLCLSVGRFFALQGVNPCEHPVVSCDPVTYNPLSAQVEAIYSFAASATSEPIFLGLYIIGLLLFLVTGYLWIVTAQAVSTLTREGAMVVTSVPVAAMMIVLTVSVF